MEKQIIISISREFGSEGHLIAEKIAEYLGISFYDRNMLDAIAEEKNMNVEHLEKYDEKPRNVILSRRVNGHSNSMVDHLVEFQFEYLQKKAESGESFVIVGRCAETALKDYDSLISIFIFGDKKEKIAHVMEKYKLSEKEALLKMARHDKSRRAYHNRYSDQKWGHAKSYDLCINSSKLGIEKSAKVLETYIQERVGHSLK